MKKMNALYFSIVIIFIISFIGFGQNCHSNRLIKSNLIQTSNQQDQLLSDTQNTADLSSSVAVENYINVSHITTGTVSSELFGVNILYWVDFQKDDDTLRTRLKDVHVGAMRFPGGTVSGNYNWRTNQLKNPFVFPKEYEAECYADFITDLKLTENTVPTASFAKAHPCFDDNGGQSENQILNNSVKCSVENSTVEFTNYRNCVTKKRPDYKRFLVNTKAIGAEAIFVVNVAGAYINPKSDGAANLQLYADEAAAWVRDVKNNAAIWAAKHPGAAIASNPFNVKYWEIGNENYLESSAHQLTASEYAVVFNVFAKAMRAQDPEIKLGAVGAIGLQSGWWDTVATYEKQNETPFDFAILHDYDNTRVTNGSINLETEPLASAVYLARFRESIAQKLGTNEKPAPLQLAITEWNITNEVTKEHIAITPIEHCLVVAEKLISYVKASVDLAAFWPLKLLDGKSDSISLLADMENRPVVLAFKSLASKAASGNILATSSQDPLVDVLATETATATTTEHTLRIFIVNRHNAEILKAITGVKGNAKFEVLSLTANGQVDLTDKITQTEVQNQAEGRSGTNYRILLPAKSFTLIEFELTEQPALLASVQKAVPLGKKVSEFQSSYTLVYKHIDAIDLHLSVWDTIPNQSTRGAVIFFHGGAWREGDASQFSALAKKLSEQLGLLAISVEYRLDQRKDNGTLNVVPLIEDAQSAIQFVRFHANELGIDPEKIAAGGGSAGAHLALAANIFADIGTTNLSAYIVNGTSVSPLPNALILFNPMLEVPGDAKYSLTQFWSQQSALLVNSPFKLLPPTLIMHGESDVISAIQKVINFSDKANSFFSKESAPVTLIKYPLCEHNFFNYDNDTGCTTPTVTNDDLQNHPQVNFNNTANEVIQFINTRLTW